MGCCANCFGDLFLAKQIEDSATQRGNCSYCNAENTALIEPDVLRDHFESLTDVYRQDPNGKTLLEWFRGDWNIFDSLDDAHAKDLMAEIFDDGNIIRKRYQPTTLDDGGVIERWQSFREELKHENRFFPKNIPDLDRLAELLQEHLCSFLGPVSGSLYRARVMESHTPYPVSEMGKPPALTSTHGRANPIGIPYLYLASDVETAVAETRPHTGENICVAEFQLLSELRIADLRNPRMTISPFSALSNEQDIAQLRNEIGFLCQLGDELTRPVSPMIAPLEYLPSQYLCEFIKHLRFEGVMYRSSVAAGTNYAIFDEELTKPRAVSRFLVTAVSITCREQ